jgi:uncharacterized membrane protein
MLWDKVTLTGFWKEVNMEVGAGGAAGFRPFKPEVFASYGNGWRQLWRHFLPLFLIGLIFLVISVAISTPQFMAQFSTGTASPSFGVFAALWGLVGAAFSIFISGPLGYGQYFAYLKASRGDNVEVQDLFAAFKNYWRALGAYLLVAIIIGACLVISAIISLVLIFGGEGESALVSSGYYFLLLLVPIIPGIYFACKLAFVPFLVVDKRMSVGKAFGESWRMASHGRGWKVFLLGLLAIPIFIAGLIVFGVGVIISYMWAMAAFASLYHAIDVSREPPVNP